MNILIKLTCLIGLVIAPILGGHAVEEYATKELKKEISLEVKVEASKNETTKIVQLEANTVHNTSAVPEVPEVDKK